MIKKKSVGARIGEIVAKREVSLLLLLIVLYAFITWRNPAFLTLKTQSDMFVNYSYTTVLSFGMLLVLLIGGIDISIGSILGFSGMAGALLLQSGTLTQTWSAFIFSALVGAACGVVIGLVIAKGKVIPIIATLGFQFIFRGLTYIISGNAWVGSAELPEGFKTFALDTVLGVNNMIWIFLLLFVVFYVFLKWTSFGRQIYAVGSNPEAAKISGIPIDRIKILVYTINGAIAGLSGMMVAAKYKSVQNEMGQGYEMDVIAACVIGGVSLNGGQGSAIGVLLGAVAIATITTALPLVKIVDPLWQKAIKGGIILLAVVVNVLMERSSNRKALKGREI